MLLSYAFTSQCAFFDFLGGKQAYYLSASRPPPASTRSRPPPASTRSRPDTHPDQMIIDAARAQGVFALLSYKDRPSSPQSLRHQYNLRPTHLFSLIPPLASCRRSSVSSSSPATATAPISTRTPSPMWRRSRRPPPSARYVAFVLGLLELSRLTPLQVQSHQLGQLLRRTYFDPASPSYISGIRSDLVDNNEVHVRVSRAGVCGLARTLSDGTRGSGLTDAARRSRPARRARSSSTRRSRCCRGCTRRLRRTRSFSRTRRRSSRRLGGTSMFRVRLPC